MKRRWQVALGCLCALVAVAHSAAVPTQDTLVIAREDTESSTSPSTDVEPTTEGPAPPVKLTEMAVTSEVSLRYAHTAVVTKVRNPAKKAQEATFRVLLPETAFISGFVMILDGKPYKAYVKEKEEAKKIYSEAVSAGVGAAHIAAKARDSNHFTVSVNVEPNTTAVFNLTYEELLVRRNKVYNHAINLHPGALVAKLTVAVHIKEAQKITTLRVPAIRTGNEIDATEDDAQNANAVISRGHDDREATITFAPNLDEQKRLMQIYADKSKESQSQHHSWRDTSAEDNSPEGVLGQFVVQYDVDRPEGGEILVNDGYFVHFFAPSNLPPLNKHVVFVLDTSGSMMNRKIVQLREAMKTILSELNPGDYFSIVEFATSVKVHDLKEAEQEPVPEQYYSWEERPARLVPPARASAANRARAARIVDRLSANGGTNIASALNVAVDLINKGIDWTPNATDPNPTPSNDAPVALPDTQTTEPATGAEPASEATKAAKLEDKKDEGKKLEPIIIFLTDGDPTVGETDPTRIINRLQEKNYGKNKAAIYSLAFGEDADRKFLRKLSLRNEGFMRHIYEAADAALQLRDLYRQVASPLLADVHFTYPKEQIKEGSLTKNKFRTYYAGSETVVAGRVADSAAPADITPTIVGVCGVDDEFNKRMKYEISPKVPTQRPAGEYLPLERVWAYLTIKQLLDEKDASDAPADKDKEDTPEKKALEIALKYEFVTPLTSLVVVKPNATNAVDAESVDKQSSPFSGPALASASFGYGSPGLPGPPSYKAALSSAIGHVQVPQYASYAPSAGLPLLDTSAFALEETSDYESEADMGRDSSPDPNIPTLVPLRRSPRLRARNKNKLFYDHHEAGVIPHTTDSTSLPTRWNFRGPSGNIHSIADHSQQNSHSYVSGLFGISDRSSMWTTPYYKPGRWSSSSDDDLIALRVGTDYTSTVPPASTPLLPPSDLERLHLQEYSWLKDALTANAISMDVTPANTTDKVRVVLELTEDASNVPKEATDSSCARATDGAAGVCVYLTRCSAAKSITLQDYTQIYCTVNNKFAGVCCPTAAVVEHTS